MIHEYGKRKCISMKTDHFECKDTIEINKKNDLTYLTYPTLSNCKGIKHGFSTRLGGVSKGIFSSMNLGLTRGDVREDVLENFRRIADALEVSCEDMVFSDQTHTTNVRVVTQKDRGNGITREKDFFDTDGMVTNVPGLVLVTFYADCVPLYFVDPIHHAIGLTHSGWRGTVGRIGTRTVETMQQTYGTKPSDIIAVIGPSICKDCYEVSEDVADAFKQEFGKASEKICRPYDSEQKKQDVILYSKSDGKYQLDLWQANRRVMLEAGILEEHICVSGLCTCCNPDFLFSHRASHGRRGNLAAFLSLNR